MQWDQKAGQDLVEFLDGLVRRHRQVDVKIFDTVGGENASAAAIGNDGQTLARGTGGGGQDFGCGEQFAEGFDTHGAGPFERGVEHAVRTDQGAGMGRSRLGAGGVTTGLEDDHRLGAGCDLERGDEAAGVADAFDVKKDRLGFGVVGQKVEDVAEIDIGRVAEREQGREAEIVRAGPVGDSRAQGARLRHEREIAGRRFGLEEGAVHLVGAAGEADAVRADEADIGFTGGRNEVGFELDAFAADLAEAGGEDHGVLDALAAAFADDAGHELGRSGDEREVDVAGYRADVGKQGLPETSWYFGLMATRSPAKPPLIRFEKTTAPTEVPRSLAPNTAMDRALKKASRVLAGIVIHRREGGPCLASQLRHIH